jgi:transcriptional regulator with XRE-family HTH domain
MSMIIDDATWTVSDRFKRARILAGLDQAAVARALGVSRQAISSWEQGHTEPSASSFVRLARLTGQPLDWFADGVNAETAPAEAGAVSNVRHEGLEPPTFWSVVSLDDEYEMLLCAEAVAS